jgi:2-polyprenyl-6-methoxyphenol hydroxylase-like FAD-dependent oxidoreductase
MATGCSHWGDARRAIANSEGITCMENRDILISGASVAGPALAYWLRHYGFNPTIVERATEPRSGGQAIDLRGTARTIVERMGVMEDIRRAHTGTRGMSVVNSTGKQLASMGSDVMGGSGGLIAEIEILRGDLVRILYETTRNDVEYIFDDSITSIAQDDAGARVTFERSAPRTFDLVVGADGLHSNVRKLAFGEESRFTRDLGCFVAIFSAANEFDLNGWELIYQIPGSRRKPGKSVGLYPVRENSEVRAMFYFTEQRANIDRHDIAQQKQLLAASFAGEGWLVPRLLNAMWASPEFYFDRVAQVRMDRWSSGRVALLGDAGYCPSPMSGMGTSLAIVGAYVLAGELATARMAKGDYTAAFARYQREMREAVARAQKFANGANGFLLPKSRTQMWMVNQVMRMMEHGPFKGLMSSGVEKAANAVTLKDYQQVAGAAPVRLG